MSHTWRCPKGDEITGGEGRIAGDDRNGLCRGPDHIARVGPLQNLIPHPAFNAQTARAFGQLIRRDHDRPDGTGVVEVFARRPLMRFTLVITHGSVVEHSIAKDMFQGGFL